MSAKARARKKRPKIKPEQAKIMEKQAIENATLAPWEARTCATCALIIALVALACLLALAPFVFFVGGPVIALVAYKSYTRSTRG